MGNLALVDDGHGLEATVRVRAHATPALRGLEVLGTGMVQQQERAQRLAVVGIAEQRTHGKAVAHPVGAGGFIDTQNLFQQGFLLVDARPGGRPQTVRRTWEEF